jgi:GPH family glycoside/pentoside/hexuronide:cation symporter
MISDAVEAEADRSEVREDGLFVSSISFGVKAGLAFGTALTAYVLGWSGYQPGHVAPAVVTAITWLFYAGPAAAIALNMLVLSSGQPRAKHLR